MRILVNTVSTKKISGGAFQISQNFLLKTLEHRDVEWYYITSQDLDDVIGEQFNNIRGKRYFSLPTQPDFKHTYAKVKKQIKLLEQQIKPDVVYSITAPSYFTFEATEVMRFTNPLVTHPNKYSKSTQTWIERIRTWLYCKNQVRLMKKAHFFITQTETTKQGILRITGLPENHVCVVNNVLPSVFKHMDNTPIVEDDFINIACVGNPVPHKNFDILPDVLIELKRLGIENVRFHTTIPFDHPLNNKLKKHLNELGMMKNWKNYGRISQKELGAMYQRCQLCYLPTLLEVFSASTVEAMYFNLPIVATNFSFNTEVLADSSLYYEPKNAKAAAQQLAKLIADKALQEEMKEKMKIQLAKYGDYDKHFNAIKAFLLEVANVSNN
ncbi:MAG: glycosyltransferase [Prevotella sp.]|nr:glycosyltransferase [Prevotella sp.]MDY5665819.1 glycosyltransferase [Alloprevotella sp.]